MVRNKARLVAKRYNQEDVVDYNRTCVLVVARLEAIRMLFSFSSLIGTELYHMDVKCAFLNGYL